MCLYCMLIEDNSKNYISVHNVAKLINILAIMAGIQSVLLMDDILGEATLFSSL